MTTMHNLILTAPATWTVVWYTPIL